MVTTNAILCSGLQFVLLSKLIQQFLEWENVYYIKIKTQLLILTIFNVLYLTIKHYRNQISNSFVYSTGCLI